MMPKLHRDGTWSFDNRRIEGYWTRHLDGKSNRGVEFGTWQGCWKGGGQDSPKFKTRKELVQWLRANDPQTRQKRKASHASPFGVGGST